LAESTESHATTNIGSLSNINLKISGDCFAKISKLLPNSLNVLTSLNLNTILSYVGSISNISFVSQNLDKKDLVFQNKVSSLTTFARYFVVVSILLPKSFKRYFSHTIHLKVLLTYAGTSQINKFKLFQIFSILADKTDLNFFASKLSILSHKNFANLGYLSFNCLPVI